MSPAPPLPDRIAGRRVTRLTPIAGGDINDAYLAELDGDDAGRAFVKTRAGAAPGEYPAEAAGLRWLGEVEGGVHVPRALEATATYLALEWLEPGGRADADANTDETLGRTLARTHAAGAPAHGATPTGAATIRLGPLELPSTPTADGPAFYAEQRLRPLLDRAPLSPSGRAAVERVCDRIDALAGPPEPPARLHGDLWSGNVHVSGGVPYLIDPAAYGGHREIDLAMLHLFGSPSPATMRAYEEVAPLAEGHEERRGLWQLFPLLVHAVLFGGAYAASVERTARRLV